MVKVAKKPPEDPAVSGTKRQAKKVKKDDFNLDLDEMAQAGLQFGHKTSRCHPKMKPYLYGTRNSIHIINLDETKEKFVQALKFIQELISQNKTLLLVGTKIQIKGLVKEIAVECGLPYVSERWLGGTLTNFETILKRIEYFNDLARKKESGELQKYTKKEQAKFNKNLYNLERKFGGIKKMSQVPDVVLVLDIRKNDLAVKEAKMKKIKVIGVIDTNCDPTLVDYPIPANDDSASSIKYILEKVKEVILKAKSEKLETTAKS